ncbi:universal stress protein [Pokkaliibacter sp. CJK22405]|uniref:universal stress protein n=1 Tax=Pokkaliibacter sp. CJK22405 TaxID=3384615 RepID=UPI0039853F94
MTHVVACVDGSAASPVVCDYGVWASKQLSAPLTLLNVIDKQLFPGSDDWSGHLGWGTQNELLEELTSLDEQRAKIAIKQGQSILETAKSHVASKGVEAETRQRHGDVVDSLTEMESSTRLLIVGKQGNQNDEAHPVGSHIESIIRTQHKPILITQNEFKAPERLLIAYDGSPTLEKSLVLLAGSPLFQGVELHLLHVGAKTAVLDEQIRAATNRLEKAGFTAHSAVHAGEVQPEVQHYIEKHQIDMLMMGAYGHSRIRQFLIGSITTSMLCAVDIPLLILR